MTEPTALQKLLGNWTADQAAAPVTPVPINPPEAATVLETQTAPEVAGKPEPPTAEQIAAEKVAADKAAAAEKVAADKAAVAAAGPALDENGVRVPPKARRTAPVVQVELDIANATIAQLRASGESGGAAAAQTELNLLRSAALNQMEKDKATISAMSEEITALEKGLEGGAARAGPIGADMTDTQLAELLAVSGWVVQLTMRPPPSTVPGKAG